MNVDASTLHNISFIHTPYVYRSPNRARIRRRTHLSHGFADVAPPAVRAQRVPHHPLQLRHGGIVVFGALLSGLTISV